MSEPRASYYYRRSKETGKSFVTNMTKSEREQKTGAARGTAANSAQGEEISDTLRALQELRGWSNQDLADKLRVSDQMAERLLQGKSRPLPAIRRRIFTWADKELSS
jgi:ribosome-binding protein aMBF1 (putative translation factor)